MNTIIQIEGDAVQIINRTVTKVVKLSDWTQKIAEMQSIELMLPSGCRLYKSKDRQRCWVTEVAPRLRTVVYKDRVYRVAFPYTISVIRVVEDAIDSFSLFYRSSSLRSIEDALFQCNLPNISSAATVCLGTLKVDVELPMHERIDLLQDLFWESGFNDDLSEFFYRYGEKDKRLESFESWQAATRENSLFPLEVEWRQIGVVNDYVH